MLVLVTVKLPRNPNHDPRNKVTGDCPVNDLPCTDVTGEHHTLMLSAMEVADAEDCVRRDYPGIHITRSEVVRP